MARGCRFASTRRRTPRPAESSVLPRKTAQLLRPGDMGPVCFGQSQPDHCCGSVLTLSAEFWKPSALRDGRADSSSHRIACPCGRCALQHSMAVVHRQRPLLVTPKDINLHVARVRKLSRKTSYHCLRLQALLCGNATYAAAIPAAVAACCVRICLRRSGYHRSPTSGWLFTLFRSVASPR